MAPVAVSTLAVPAKIVMRGNAKMTLNERFSDISPKKVQNVEQPVITARLDVRRFAPKAPPIGDVYEPTSSYNRRLTNRRRMNDRRSAEKDSRPRNMSRPVRQRLGVLSRISFPPRYNRSELDHRFYGDFANYFNGYRPRNRFFRQQRSYNNRSYFQPRFGYQRGNYKYGRIRKWRRAGFYHSFRDYRSFQRRPRVSKDELDQEIDAYMAKTKLHLDADLDAYMADITMNPF